MKTNRKKIDIRTNEETLNLKDQLIRAMADYDNLKKRVERERQDIVKLSSLSILVKLLPIVDMLEVAQTHLKDTGLAIAINDFIKVLKEDGIEKIAVEIGSKFDENIHEVIEAVPAPDGDVSKSGTILEVALSGWKYSDGTVIRHAKVKVVGEVN